MKAINQIIRDLREDKDLRQSDIAAVLGTTQQHYSRCEKGESQLSTRSVIALANFYHVSTDYLLGRTECKQGVDVLNQQIADGYTTGRLLTEALSLSIVGRCAVVEYLKLQLLKEEVEQKGLL